MRLEDVEIGDDLPDFEPDVSMDTVVRFCEATRMVWGRFTDHEAARKEGLPSAIVPGIMSQGILVGLIHAWAPNAKIVKLDTIFRAPLVVDTRPRCRGVVTDLRDDERIVEIDMTIVNEHTRATVENPVVRCLKEGRVITLAENSTLITRGGDEVPIQDSAAPIRLHVPRDPSLKLRALERLPVRRSPDGVIVHKRVVVWQALEPGAIKINGLSVETNGRRTHFPEITITVRDPGP